MKKRRIGSNKMYWFKVNIPTSKKQFCLWNINSIINCITLHSNVIAYSLPKISTFWSKLYLFLGVFRQIAPPLGKKSVDAHKRGDFITIHTLCNKLWKKIWYHEWLIVKKSYQIVLMLQPNRLLLLTESIPRL